MPERRADALDSRRGGYRTQHAALSLRGIVQVGIGAGELGTHDQKHTSGQGERVVCDTFERGLKLGV